MPPVPTCGACPVCQRQHLRSDALYHRDELCVRVGVGVGGVQAVDVAQQHQQVGMDAAGDDGGQRVIVADGGDLVGGNGVVLVDDGQRPQFQQPGQGVLEIQPRPSCSTSTPVSRICATLWL